MSEPTYVIITPNVTTVEVTPPGQIVQTNTVSQVIEIAPQGQTIVSAPLIETVIIGVGPQGIQGPAGTGSVGSAIAGENISIYTVVVILNDLMFKADPTNSAHVGKVVGVTTQGGLAGVSLTYASAGTISGGSFIATSEYFAGLNGSLSTIPRAPGVVWAKQVGYGQSSTELFVALQPTIVVN